jgi:hypothetical protein
MNLFKKTMYSIAVCMLLNLSLSFAQDAKGLAKVTKIQGIESYFLCEPLREYEVVFDEKTGLKATSLITGGLVNESISEKANQFVKRVAKEAEKENIKIDAVIYSGGKKIVAIKFTEAASAKNKGIARVKKINGVNVYVLCEPSKDYEVVNKKGGGLKMKSALTAGLVNNSIEEDVEQLVNRVKKDADSDGKEIDGVVYSSGKSAIGVKFK